MRKAKMTALAIATGGSLLFIGGCGLGGTWPWVLGGAGLLYLVSAGA
jgi:hypothetical protein